MQNAFHSLLEDSALSKEKLDFLSHALTNSEHLSREQLLPYFTSLIQIAKEKNLEFTDQEVLAVLMLLRSRTTPENQKKMDQLLHSLKRP